MALSNRFSYFNESQLELLRERTLELLEQHDFRITSYNVCYTKLLRQV